MSPDSILIEKLLQSELLEICRYNKKQSYLVEDVIAKKDKTKKQKQKQKKKP